MQNVVFHPIMEIRGRQDPLDHSGCSLGSKVQESRKGNKQINKKALKL